jgi:hypothetical protein
MEIIEEELEPFFSGSKTAEETAEIIHKTACRPMFMSRKDD